MGPGKVARSLHRRCVDVFGGLAIAVFSWAMFLAVPISAQTSANVTTTANSEANVEGFRSAKFGMTMDEVRAAIEADFSLAGDAIALGENPIERTALLSVVASDVLEGGGAAQVSYVFGHTSGALIQVGVSWNADADPALTEAQLVANGDILRNHFLSSGYVPETIETGTILEQGIVLFRGRDANGRATVLLLQGQFTDDASGARVLAPTSLALIYTIDPEQPDVFRIKEGEF